MHDSPQHISDGAYIEDMGAGEARGSYNFTTQHAFIILEWQNLPNMATPTRQVKDVEGAVEHRLDWNAVLAI